MKQINFTLIFLLCLAIVIFSLENTQPVNIKIISGLELKAPLCVELILAMGFGAILAWLFTIWSKLQSFLISQPQIKEINKKNQRIQELEQNLETYKTEKIQSQLPPSNSTTQT